MAKNRGNFGTPGTNSPFRNRPAEESLQTLPRHEGRQVQGRRAHPARQDERRRDGLAHHEPTATRPCTASATRTTTAPATPGASTRCTTTRTRSRMRWKTSRIRCARWNSRTTARSTTGCWTTLADGGFFQRPVPRQYEFARLNLTYVVTCKRKLRQLVDEKHRHRLGRSAHADHRRPAPPRLHAGIDPAVLRAHRRVARPTAGST